MPEIKYLYGASVVGIQQFIFQTDKLKDIAGASEIVQQICTRKFSETVGRIRQSQISGVKSINDV